MQNKINKNKSKKRILSTCIQDDCGMQFESDSPEKRNLDVLKPFWKHYCPKHRVRTGTRRILSVIIKREIDTDPDTSWLGEYSDKCTSEFSIDRMHSEDCIENDSIQKDKLGRIAGAIENDTPVCDEEPNFDCDRCKEEQAYKDAREQVQELAECDCGEHGDMRRGTYRYFNPSFNYVDKNGHASDENTAEEVRKYVRQGYERMESLNSGQWCFLSINAEAKVSIPCGESSVESTVGLNWCSGYESDMGKSGMEEVEADHLSELRKELKALGFSSRAISQAFKNVEREEN